MNFGIIRRVLGSLLIVEAVLMLPGLLIALSLKEASASAIAIGAVVTLLAGGGLLLSATQTKSTLRSTDGLAIVALGWVLISIFGAIPFLLSGFITSPVDAIFETVSGFTTTGATILEDVEILDRGIMFWRIFTQWIGGMGILVFSLALLPALGIGSFQIFKAETPGPTVSKIAPRMKNTARILYLSYVSLTITQVILLKIGGLSLYDAVLHAFSTMGTGGFSIYNDSMGSLSDFVQVTLAVFMVLASLNFSLYYLLYQGKWREVVRNQEVRFFFSVIGMATLLLTLNLTFRYHFTFLRALRDGFVQVTSMISSTAMTIHDFTEWPHFSQVVLLILMFIGGCAGSTAGGMKAVRVLVAGKLVKREFSKMAHPRAFSPIRLDGRIMPNEVVAGITSFLALHLIVFLLGTLLISLENYDLVTSLTSVAATLNNVGPGLSLLGPKNNYAFFNDFSKIILTLLMLLGRLELYTVLVLLAPRKWLDES
ncbi:MAG TPA: TrkH family potassium uptake protein [Tissierellia bacterium]|nr:TrkH family potassium uptake protein [Tissierellia bacterium]